MNTRTVINRAVLGAISSLAIFATAQAANAINAIESGSILVNGSTFTPTIENNAFTIGANGDAVCLGTDSGAYGIAIKSLDTPLTGNVLGKTISLNSNFRTIYATWWNSKNNPATLNIGNESTETINITMNGGHSDDGSSAIMALDLGTTTLLTAKNIKITSNGDFAVQVAALHDELGPNLATLSLTAVDNGDISVVNTAPDGVGLAAYSGGTLNIKGNLNVKAKTAIETRGDATININTDGKASTVIDGDIVFGTTDHRSGHKLNANLNLNLTGSDSVWTGNLKTEYPANLSESDQKVTNAAIIIADGAQWNVTKVNEVTEGSDISKSLALNNLTLKDGVVSIQDTPTTVKIGNLEGSGGTVNVAASTDDGTTLTTAKLEASTSSVEILDVALTGIDADDISNADSALASAADAVSAGDSKTTVTIKEGAVNGAITADTTGGTVKSVTTTENTKLAAFNSVSAMATMAWRHDMNDLTKRMGELRDSPEGIGSWVRFYGSEQEYGRQNMTSKSTSVQLGSDYDIVSGWKVGGAFTYTDGTSKYDNGSSDNKAYGVAAYGSWLADNGAFVDLIGKYSRLSSDFELSSMDGKSKNNALSASVEAGWHIPFAELAFVEPQAELTYGVVLGDDFTTSNGVKISQEDTEALIGRLGVRTGFHFPNKKGTVYARASVLHDFKGESEFSASLVDDASVRSTMKDDIGGTYYEIGVGANFNWTDNAYSYVDIEKQNGGDVKENWRWNVGFRYVW